MRPFIAPVRPDNLAIALLVINGFQYMDLTFIYDNCGNINVELNDRSPREWRGSDWHNLAF
jgi:hypothetical protein